MKKIVKKYAALSMFWKFTLTTVGVFLVFLIFVSLIQWSLIGKAGQRLEVKSLQEMSDRLLEELDDTKSEESDVRPFLKYYVDKYEHDNLEINILDAKGGVVDLSEAQKWKSFIKHQTVTRETFQIEEYLGEEYTVFRIPVSSGKEIYTVEYVKKNDALHVILQDYLYVFILPFLFATILSLLAGLFLSRQFVTQIHDLATDVNQIKKDGLSHRLKMKHDKDELNQVRLAFNDLLDKVEGTMTQQQQFIEDASHELRTPISVFKGHLNMLNRFGKNDKKILDDSLMRMTKEVGRFEHMVEDLLTLSKLEHMQIENDVPEITLVPCIQEVEERFQMIDETVIFENACDTSCVAKIRPEHFMQLLTIFIDNGLKYTNDQPKKIKITLNHFSESILLQVRDYGIGIPQNELEHITERFFRVDKARSRSQGGAGLGLSIADRLIQKYGFRMEVESELHKGTTIKIYM